MSEAKEPKAPRAKRLKIAHGSSEIFVPDGNGNGWKITQTMLNGPLALKYVQMVEQKTGRELMGRAIIWE